MATGRGALNRTILGHSTLALSVALIEGRAGDGQVCAGRAEGGAEGRATAGEAPPVVARLRPLPATPQGHPPRRHEVSRVMP